MIAVPIKSSVIPRARRLLRTAQDILAKVSMKASYKTKLYHTRNLFERIET